MESLSAGYGHVVVATATQCYVYGAGRWGSPAIVDTKGSVLFVRQAEKCFLTVDAVLGLRVLSYEGRQLSLPKAEGGGPGQFVKACVSLSNDTLAVVTRKKPSTVQASLVPAPFRPRGSETRQVASGWSVPLLRNGAPLFPSLEA